MSIAHWPVLERPREKLLHHGAKTLSDAELLAIFLRTGTRGKTAVDVARGHLLKYGNLRSILNLSLADLRGLSGVGEATAALLIAALELSKRCAYDKLDRDGCINNPADVAEYLMHELRDRQQEVFSVMLLDNRHQVIKYLELFFGTINGATVHPREVVKTALAYNAAAIIVAHNHPSGIAEPSQSDASITIKLREALQLVDVKLLDHIVIGDGEYVSLSDRGLM